MSDLPENYNINDYDRPSVAVDIAVFTIRKKASESYRHLSKPSLSILMIRRGEKPYKDFLSLPGGFITRNETMEETAQKKLEEKTGVKDLPLSLLFNSSKLGRDPRGWIVSCGYWSVVEYNKSVITEETAEWYDIEFDVEKGILKLISDSKSEFEVKFKLEDESALYNEAVKVEVTENSEIAFDHSEIIIRAILQLRNSLDRPNVAFRLLPELFTLTELQQIYETILDKELLMANFRRKISPYVEESGQISTGAGHRPSKYFKMKSNLKSGQFLEK